MGAQAIDDIIDFWLADSRDSPEAANGRRDWWYRGGAPVDAEIRTRFGAWIEQACRRELQAWQETADGAFALILLLDQFTRNVYRNTPEAYVGDPIAFDVVRHAIDKGIDRELHPVSRIWLYHPYHHSEKVEEQDYGIDLLKEIRAGAPDVWHPYIERSITGWTRHRDIVARFDRFPHRNAVLGRPSTDSERAFLKADGEAFGQGPAEARKA